MPQYTIKAVSPQVRDYPTAYGEMKAYKVKFQEFGEQPVEISQKATTNPPYVGQTMDGDIDTTGKFGPKFKRAFGGIGGGFVQAGRTATTPVNTAPARDDSHIKAQWAIGQAVAMNGQAPPVYGDYLEDVEIKAVKLFHMVDRVKTSEPPKDDGEALQDDLKQSFGDAFNDVPPADDGDYNPWANS